MDRSVEARLHAAKARKQELVDTEAGLWELLAQTQERLEQTEAAIEECDREIKLCEDATRPRGRGVAEETWRRTVRELGTFTVSELATELQVSVPTARNHLGAMLKMDPPMVKADGRILGQKVYCYNKPTEAGAAFEMQQRLRPVGDHIPILNAPARGVAIAGTGGNPWEAIPAKPVREAVRDAVRAGWKLQKRGDGHWSLWKDGQEVGVAGSPKNPDGSARLIRRGTATKQAS